MIRSSATDVRNPLTRLASCEKFRALPPEAREALIALLADLRTDAREQAEKSWRKHKAPMAAYWKAVAVYAGHCVRLLRAPA